MFNRKRYNDSPYNSHSKRKTFRASTVVMVDVLEKRATFPTLVSIGENKITKSPVLVNVGIKNRVARFPTLVDIWMALTRQIHVKMQIARPNGQWVDVTDYLEVADVELGSLESLGTGTGTDIAVRSLTFSLRNTPGKRFAPRDKNSEWNIVDGKWDPLLWPYREVSLQVSITLPSDEPTNWISLFEGYLGDSIITESHSVEVRCRDKSKLLQDSYIDVPKTYEGPISAEALIQAIIDDYVLDAPPTLYCPVPSGVTFDKMDVEYVSVWDAIQNIAKQMAWFLGYRWDGTQFVLTFLEPPRNKTTADFRLDWEDDIYRETLEIGDSEIRNALTITYRDKTTGKRVTLRHTEHSQLRNDPSIEEYRRRIMQIEEADLSLIDTQEKALAFGEMCIWDVSELSATDRLDLPLLPEMDLFSTMLVTNPQTSSTTDFFAAQSIRHTIKIGDRATYRTGVIATGRVVGARQKWLDMETRPGRPGNPTDPERIPPESLPPDRLPDYSLGVDKLMENIKPPIMVTSLPVLPDPRYPLETVIMDITTARLYVNKGNLWTAMTVTDFSELQGLLQGNQIALGAITEELIAANSITETKIADGSIETPKLAAGAITTEKLAANAVTANEINAGAITTEKLAANAVTTNKIDAGAITTEKLAANAVTADMVTAGIIQAGGIKADWYADIRNVLPYTGQDSLDPDKPIVIPFYIPSETTNIAAAFLSAEGRRYRAYAKTAPYTVEWFWNKRTGAVNKSSGEQNVTVSLDTTTRSERTKKRTLKHRHYEPGSSINIMTGDVRSDEYDLNHQLEHDHAFDYVQAIGVRLNNFDNHKHDFDASHDHKLEFGIHEDTTPSNVRLRINNGSGWSGYISLASAPNQTTSYDLISGSSVPKHNNRASEMDLKSYISGTGWKYIEFSASRLGMITWNIVLKLDITA